MEWFPLIDENDTVIGLADRKLCHNGSKLLHPVIHLHVYNTQGELYLQKRSMTKDIQPGKWDTSVGGHVDFGETIEMALHREASEELGLTSFQPIFIKRYIFESAIEKERVHVYKCIYQGDIHPDPVEIERGQFFDQATVLKMIENGETTPNFAGEYRQLFG